MKLTVLFDNLGPYHIARLTELARHCDLSVIEQRASSLEYSWEPADQVSFHRITLPGDRSKRSACWRQNDTYKILDDLNSDVIATPGWASQQAVSAVYWAISNRKPVILMSDSQERDYERRLIQEWVKKQYLTCCEAAFVAGKMHADYVEKLGMSSNRVRPCYDVVDNEYFSTSVNAILDDMHFFRTKYQLPTHFFLSSARFVEKKNLLFMLKAFSRFKELTHNNVDWHLVLIGDGPQRPQIEALISELGLSQHVSLPGFIQYSELPTYYGLASAFILPSAIEQWGLVVNEAMASGLPVLVSERCGCASDLVYSDCNGFVFDPFDLDSLLDAMLKVSALSDMQFREMSNESKKIIAGYTTKSFTRNLMELAVVVDKAPVKKPSFVARFILRILMLKACMQS